MLPAVETCMMWIRPPVASASEMSRPVMASSATAGMPGRPEDQRDQPLVHHAALGQLADFGVVQDRLVEHQAIFERPAHQLRIVDRRAVVAEGDGPGPDELADFGQFLAFAVLADAGHDEDVAMVGPGGLVLDEFDGGLAVDRRLGVGNAGDRGETAGQGGGGAGVDRFVLLASRLAQMDVHVDQPGRDDLARGVDFGVGDAPRPRRSRRCGRRR